MRWDRKHCEDSESGSVVEKGNFAEARGAGEFSQPALRVRLLFQRISHVLSSLITLLFIVK